jgi:hypothetical protein
MASVLQDIAQLRMPEDFDKEGKPTGYRKMTAEDFVFAGQNASAVAKVLTSMFSNDGKDIEVTICGQTITLATIKLDSMPKIKEKHAERMKNLALITDSVGKMATVVRDIAMMTIPKIDENTGKQIGVTKMTPEDFTKASNNVKTIMETILGVFKDEDLIDAIEDLDEDNAKVITAVMDSVGNLSSIMEVLVMIHKNQIPDITYKDGKLIKGSNPIPISDITQNRVTITQRISSLLRMPLERHALDYIRVIIREYISLNPHRIRVEVGVDGSRSLIGSRSKVDLYLSINSHTHHVERVCHEPSLADLIFLARDYAVHCHSPDSIRS